MPLVDRLDRRRRIPRVATILVLHLALAGGVLLVGDVVVPSLATQFGRSGATRRTTASSFATTQCSGVFDDRYRVTAHCDADARALPSHLARATGSLSGRHGQGVRRGWPIWSRSCRSSSCSCSHGRVGSSAWRARARRAIAA
jgi:hypothetical protein